MFARLLVLVLAAALPASAQDYAREKRWADEVVPGLVVGDAVWLQQKSGHKFLGILTEAPKPRGAVIIVHGLGIHPDWNLIGVLRTQLAENGYTTLSIQMPVLAADAKGADYVPLFPDAADRLRVAVEFLRGKGQSKIAIAAHSLGARMANHYLVQSADPGVAAWVAIAIFPAEFIDPAKLRAPVLDIYGEKDFPEVLKTADARAKAISRITGSGQVEVAGSDHYFNGKEAELARQVKLFLDQRLE
jgi:alpha-beta hydrolase superfamily lysophospholipase